MLKGRQCVEVLITLKSLQEAEYQSGSGRGDWSVGGGLPGLDIVGPQHASTAKSPKLEVVCWWVLMQHLEFGICSFEDYLDAPICG